MERSRRRTFVKGKVSIVARVSNALFGSPNFRRANGIISTKLDIAGFLKSLKSKISNAAEEQVVYAIDRLGCEQHECLPRIWVTEEICNTRRHDGKRTFTATYPNGSDSHGWLALELADSCFGEGCIASRKGNSELSKECFRAAEILYLHALSKRNGNAFEPLLEIYENDLGDGEYWDSYVSTKARHAKTMDAQQRMMRAHQIYQLKSRFAA